MNKEIQQAVEKIKTADAILIGASNGLSISEGYNIFAEDQKFIDLFSDFREKYGIRNILQGIFYKYPLEVEKWTFLSRLIYNNYHKYEVSSAMKSLYELVSDKPYFIITSNGECHFEKSGFEARNIFEIEGNILNMQCSHACHNKLYPTYDLIEKMSETTKDGRVLESLIPKCPVCGGNMDLNIAKDKYFIENKEAYKKCVEFIEKYHGKNLVILELGIGWRNRMIKAPLMEIAREEKNATYITLNKGEIYIPDFIKDKSFGLDGDITNILKEMSM